MSEPTAPVLRADADRFRDSVTLVTGASRGIGLAIAHRIVAEGGRVVITGRDPDTLAAAVESLGSGVALAVAGRGDDPEHRDDAIARTLAAYGRLDHLVNNVGINPVHGDLLAIDAGAARKILEVNVLGALEWTRAAVAAGLSRALVSVASVAGLASSPGIGFYGISKAALINMTAQLAAELAPRLRVNAVAPAVVRTRFAAALFEGREEEAAAAYPLGRLGDPADVAAAVAFLLSADAAWITGQTLILDGGASIRAIG